MKTPQPKKSKKPRNPKGDIAYTSGKVTIKGNCNNHVVASAIKEEQRIKWAWIIIAVLAMLLYHTATPAIASAVYHTIPSISKIRHWLSG